MVFADCDEIFLGYVELDHAYETVEKPARPRHNMTIQPCTKPVHCSRTSRVAVDREKV